MQFGYNFTRKWLNCTRLRLVKLPHHLLVKLYPNYTQKHVITYTYYTLTRVISLIYYIPPPLTVHFSMTRSVRYQPILHTLYYTLHTEHAYCLSYRFLNNVVITTVIEMVEMVEILDGRLGKRSVERVRHVINNLLLICKIYFVFDISNLLSYIQNNFSYELARPIMGTIFLE